MHRFRAFFCIQSRVNCPLVIWIPPVIFFAPHSSPLLLNCPFRLFSVPWSLHRTIDERAKYSIKSKKLSRFSKIVMQQGCNECECLAFECVFECECKTFAFAFECECKTFAFAFECHFKTFDGWNVLSNAFKMLGYMNIIASPDSQLRCWWNLKSHSKGHKDTIARRLCTQSGLHVSHCPVVLCRQLAGLHQISQ